MPSVGFEPTISAGERLPPDNTQHSQETDIHAPPGFKHNPSKRAAADPRLRLCGHRDGQNVRHVVTYNTHLVIRPLR